MNKLKECYLNTATDKDKVIGMQASITKEHGLVVSDIFEERRFGSKIQDFLKDVYKNKGIYDCELLDDGSVLVKPIPSITTVTLKVPSDKERNKLMLKHVFGNEKPEIDYMQITRDIVNS